MSVVEELRRNDPATTRIRILLDDETSDAALAQALEQNPFVTDIVLDLEGVQQTDWDSSLRVIAMRANLKKVMVEDSFFVDRRIALDSGLVSSILRAMQLNTAIRTVELKYVRLSTNISTFLDNASSITKFSLQDCDIDPAERQQGARSLVVALQRDKNIETLKLSRLEDIYAVPILEVLGSNVSLKTFVFFPPSSLNVSDATLHALHQLLNSSTSIQRFELHEASFSDERLFRPISQAIVNSGSLSELKFSWVSFQGRNSLAQLQSILQNKQNLTTLSLDGCVFGGGQVHEDIISILSRPDSPLRCFEFQGRYSLEEVFARIQFENLVGAIEKSKLEVFKIGIIQTQQQLLTLTQSIRSMKLKRLKVVVVCDDEEAPDFVPESISRQELRHAVKNNFSLRSVKARILLYSGEEFDLFDSAEDKQTLAFCANRNTSLDQWVDHPEIVEQRKVWPDALNLAQKAGPNALFRGLRSVLESDYVSLPGGRKRKRT